MSVTIEKKEAVFTVILNRPEHRNAVDGPTAQALFEAFDKFENDSEAKVAILYGEGGNFCAGADLKAIGSDRMNPLNPTGPGPMGPTRMILSKPVIAAISGYAVAGGLELALWCDLRVAEENAVLGVFCRRWGVPLIDGGTIRLPRLIGLSRALDLIVTGRPVDAQEALSMGLVHRLTPPGQVRTYAENLALQIASLPQECMNNDRLSAYQQHSMTLPEALQNEFEIGMRSLASPELLNGLTRFREGQGRHGKFD